MNDPIWYPIFVALLAGVVELVKRLADRYGWLQSDWWPRVIALAGGIGAAIPAGLIPSDTTVGRLAWGVIGAVNAIVAWHFGRDVQVAKGRTQSKLESGP